MKEIILKFDPRTGECKVDAKGFRGKACEEATKFLKDALGQCSDFQRKAEWYEENLSRNGQVISNLCG